MDYLTAAKLSIWLSIALFALGSLLMSLGWHIMRTRGTANKAMKRFFPEKIRKKVARWAGFTVCAILLGPLLIGVAGILSTLGWHEWANHSQKEAMLVAVVRDLRFNNLLLKVCHFEAKDEETLAEHYGYPRFYSYNVVNACASDKLNPNYPADKELLDKLLRYNFDLMSLQEFLDTTDASLYVGLGRKALDEHKRVNNSDWLKNYLKAHSDLESFLKQEYPEAWARALRIQLKPLGTN